MRHAHRMNACCNHPSPRIHGKGLTSGRESCSRHQGHFLPLHPHAHVQRDGLQPGTGISPDHRSPARCGRTYPTDRQSNRVFASNNVGVVRREEDRASVKSRHPGAQWPRSGVEIRFCRGLERDSAGSGQVGKWSAGAAGRSMRGLQSLPRGAAAPVQWEAEGSAHVLLHHHVRHRSSDGTLAGSWSPRLRYPMPVAA